MSTFGHSGFTCDNVQWWKECSVSTTVLTSTGRQTCVCMYVCECECVYLQARWWWRRAGSRCRMSGRWLQKRRESDSRCLESLRSVKQREQQWERSSQTNIYKPRIWDIRYKKMYCLCFTHTHTHTHTPPAGPLRVCGDRPPIHCKTSHPPPREAQRNSGKVT